MHILRGVLIADIKGEGAQAFENANGYLGCISTLQLQQTLLRLKTHCNSVDAFLQLNQLFQRIEECTYWLPKNMNVSGKNGRVES